MFQIKISITCLGNCVLLELWSKTCGGI